MRILKRSRPSPALVVASLALVLALTGVAAAALAGSDGSLTTCIGKSGTVLVIDPAKTSACPSGQAKARLAGNGADGRVRDSNRLGGATLSEARAGIDAALLDDVLAGHFARLTDGKVADAAELDGLTSGRFALKGSALDAETLDGIDSLGYLKTSQKAAAAGSIDTLGGLSRQDLTFLLEGYRRFTPLAFSGFLHPSITVTVNSQGTTQGVFDVDAKGLRPGSVLMIRAERYAAEFPFTVNADGMRPGAFTARCGDEYRVTGESLLFGPVESEPVSC